MDFVNEALLQNPHWENGVLEFPRLAGPLVERDIFPSVARSVSRKFITILRGLRRVGKSVLARQVAFRKIKASGNPTDVAWFEFDRAMGAKPEDMDLLLNFFRSRGASMVILDEIAFVPKWQDVLKRHYDRTDTKFLATGSSAIDLDRRTAESLAGRTETVEVRPFSISERMRLVGEIPPSSPLELSRQRAEMLSQAGQYLVCGGLPEITSDADFTQRQAYVKNSLLDPLFYKDFPAAFPQANPDLLRKTLELLSGTSGGTFQLQSIAEALGYSHTTAGTQLELLEKTLLVRTLYNSTPSIAKQKRTAKKIVFADNGILAALNPELPPGVLAENAALEALGSKLFWRDGEGREIDAILPESKTAVEVKYQNSLTTRDEKNIGYFLERKRGWRGVLITKSDSDSGDIARVPLWRVLLNPDLIARHFSRIKS
ncbi:ATP-binding protein [Candidatus Micrarchaeota archaeon]|nr:ATP-binding protein [Candidatus Micrarchaeota archaeon]